MQKQRIEENMVTALVFNPGSNSLKFELVTCDEQQQVASEAKKLTSAAIDGIGKETKLLVYEGDRTSEQQTDAQTMPDGVRVAMEWLHSQETLKQSLQQLSFIGVRVVHGGSNYSSAVRVTQQVRADIEALEDLAPLHNQSSIAVLDAMQKELPAVPVFVAFDTSFHRTMPEKAWRYPIERDVADQFGVRKYGFHGISHRYMLEHYARCTSKRPEDVTVVTLHLESGSSACAVERGRSVDTTMGLTPLEGLMMGSRSGSIDPAIVPFLARKLNKSAEDVLTILNKQSGLLGIAGGSLDTRELVEREDDAAKLALDMYSYRVRLAVGAYLAALSNAEAVLFGGGIGEDSPWLRESVCAGLGGWGMQLDPEANRSIKGMCRITRDDSRLHAWALPVEEGLQIVHECLQAYLAASA